MTRMLNRGENVPVGPIIRRGRKQAKPLPVISDLALDIVQRLEIDNASVADIERTITQAFNAHTAALRDALLKMRQDHGRRFPLHGSCHCDACKQADKILDARN